MEYKRTIIFFFYTVGLVVPELCHFFNSSVVSVWDIMKFVSKMSRKLFELGP